jgi:hypothetical protein
MPHSNIVGNMHIISMARSIQPSLRDCGVVRQTSYPQH